METDAHLEKQYFYQYQTTIMRGVTARILRQFLEIYQQTLNL